MNKIQQAIAKIIKEEFGYEVLEWPASASNVMRPKVVITSDPSGGVKRCVTVTPVGDDVIIHDFRGMIRTHGSFDLSGSEIKCEQKLANLKTKIDSQQAVAKDKFVKRWAKITASPELPLGEHLFFNEKKLKPLSGKRYKLKSVDTFETKNLREMDAIVVPFQNANRDIVGAQLRTTDSKLSVTDSVFKDAFHIVQEGHKDKFLLQKICLIVESYSTALEIAECRIRDMVVCCAGQSHMKATYEYFNEDPELFCIAVLDKNKYSNKHKAQYKATEELIKYFSDKPSIIPAEHDPRAAKCTDFNDLAIAIGKDEAHNRINQRVLSQLPAAPKIFNAPEGTGFNVISSIDFKQYHVAPEKIKPMLNQLATPQFWRQFGYDKFNNDKLHTLFIEEAAVNKMRNYVGVGIYKEEDSIIYNGYNGYRFLYDGKEINKCATPVPINLLYSTVDNKSEAAIDINKPFNPEFLHEMLKEFKLFYGPEGHKLMSILGWLVQASYAAQTSIRSHFWLTGTSASGKGMMLNLVTQQLAPQFTLLFEDFTEASIRTNLLAGGAVNSPIVCCDENSPEDPNKKQRLELLISMARAAATNSNAISSRATSDQKAINFIKRFAMLLSGTYAEFKDIQDRSRFNVLEIKGSIVGKPLAEYQRLETAFADNRENFIKMLLYQRDFYIKAIDFMTGHVNRIYKDQAKDIASIGHSITSMARILAGVAVLVKQIYPDLTDEEVAVKTLECQDDFIQYNLADLQNFCSSHLSVGGDLFLTRIKKGAFESVALWQLLISAEYGDDYWDRYGLALKRVDGKLAFVLQSPSRRWEALFADQRKLEDSPLLGLKQKLKDLSAIGKEVKSIRPRIDGKRYTAWVVFIDGPNTKKVERHCAAHQLTIGGL